MSKRLGHGHCFEHGTCAGNSTTSCFSRFYTVRNSIPCYVFFHGSVVCITDLSVKGTERENEWWEERWSGGGGRERKRLSERELCNV